ncbi:MULTISPECIES: acyl carrier protein [Proteiniclasticum]|jgi:acyl carrier protein|uniref:Acyl carrier protein n=1 Tax=Proteiniclasticum ruminis TaxID=398199 RepID=A0A1G8NRY9_9CLOT|nr:MULTISPECIES: acyl carrier protein [Proteiniclasticum]SDI82953.1 acyl carrier protein [Proteiniclasticum ruminis]SFN28423.1 acyl carrier protein [Proteiniclasticum ruminis]
MIFEKVKEILMKELNLSGEEVTMEASFEALGIDSLDLVELVMQLEEEFDISMEETEEMKTVEDVVRYIEKAKEA